MKAIIPILLVTALLPCLAVSQDCIDYRDYLHRVGRADTPFIAYDVSLAATHAYVADSNNRLQVIDIADPDAPMLINSVDVTGSATGVCVAGDHAFVAVGAGGLMVLDLTEPASPAVVGSTATPGSAVRVTVVGNLAYVVGDAGLYVIDVSDPTAPSPSGLLALDGALDVAAAEGLVCVAADALYVVDVSVPESPTVLGTLSIPESLNGVAVVRRYAYLAAGGPYDEGSLHVVDLANPKTPTLVGSAATYWAEGVAVVGDLAYTCGLVPSTWHGRFQVIDVADPTSPHLLVAVETLGQARRLALSGDHAFVADGGGGLQAIDTVNPAAPSLRGAVTTPGDAGDVDVVGALAYVADWTGLQLIDVAKPEQPKLAGRLDYPSTVAVTAAGGYAYIPENDAQRLRIVDCTDPATPILGGVVDLPGHPLEVAVTGAIACVAANEAGLQIVDVADAYAPVLVGALMVGERALHVVAAGELVYALAGVGMWNSGILIIIDISDPTAPKILGSTWLDVSGAIALGGSYVFILGESSLYVVDVSVATAPELVGEAYLFTNARKIAVAGDFAYVTEDLGGYHLVDVSNPTAPSHVQTVVQDTEWHVAMASSCVCFTNGIGLDTAWLQCADPSVVLDDSGARACGVENLRVYPNPFNPLTTINFDLPRDETVGLRVYDVKGRLVRELLADVALGKGQYDVIWKGRDNTGRAVASGVYVIYLDAGDFVESRRMVFLK